MTQLLISVRNAPEARIALAGGAQVIDVKEPHRGSLGRAELSVINEVCAAVENRAWVSVALGELLETEGNSGQLPAGIRWAKLGLAGCARRADWETIWLKQGSSFSSDTKPVAVVYADYLTAHAPTPAEILQAAGRAKCKVLLIDTFDKTHGRLLDIWPLPELTGFCQSVQQAGMELALAGSLKLEDIRQLSPISPQFLAFRGAACEGRREGQLKQHLVEQLAAAVQQIKEPLTK